MPEVNSQNGRFPFYHLRNPINVCPDPQNSASFFQDDRFEVSHA